MAWIMAENRVSVSVSTAASLDEGGATFGTRSRTLGGWVLAKVLGLVSAQNAGGLDVGGGATGKLLVEVDDALHGDAIGVGANRLLLVKLVAPFLGKGKKKS